MEKQFCVKCDKYIDDYEITLQKETFEIRGVKFEVAIQVPTCKICHEEMYIQEIERKNEVIIYDTYKKIVGLLTSTEIKQIREKRGLSQRQLARLIYVGDKDITRYENGAIQNKSIDLLIRLVGQDVVYKNYFLKQNPQK